MSTKLRRARGLTLVEAIVFLVVVSIGVAAILNIFDRTTSSSVDPLRRKQAQMIAEALMEEVQLARMTFCDPASPNWDVAVNTAGCTAAGVGATAEGWGPETALGNARPFDNVNDYVSGSGQATASFNSGANLVDVNGGAFPAGYSATVTITPVTLTQNGIELGATSAADNDALQITITVSYDNTSLSLTSYRTRYAPRAS
jgi:MSHA pilin protein MshD